MFRFDLKQNNANKIEKQTQSQERQR
jgi:hypothetical protein